MSLTYALIVINSKNSLVEKKFSKSILSIGSNKSLDLTIDHFPLSECYLVNSQNGFTLIQNGEKQGKSEATLVTKPIQLSKDTKELINHAWLIKDWLLILRPVTGELENQVTTQKSLLTNWDFSILPKNPYANDFPQKMLEFILQGIKHKSGALFYIKNEEFQTLAKVNLELKDHAENLLRDYVKNIPTKENFLKINFATHSILFKTGLTPSDFWLIKCFINEDQNEYLFTYIPVPKTDSVIGQDLVLSLLYLFSQSLISFITFQENKKLKRLLSANYQTGDFIWGEHPSMVNTKKLIDKVALTDLIILILGETGTGKDQIAGYIAEKCNKKLVSINCAAIPENLAESTLFGHEKGAFTGATSSYTGKIVEAQQGILFLDEVGELSLDIQAKLLRFLQNQIITPVGGKDRLVKTRIIAATNRDLKEMVLSGKFREDLYFRLNEISVTLPPLNTRGKDILVLAQYFLEKTVELNQLEQKIFAKDVLKYLLNYNWPGNIRELKSLVRKSAILSEQKIIQMDDLGLSTNSSSTQFDWNLNNSKEQFLRAHVQKALIFCNGNKTKAAELLGISLRNLYRLMDVTPNSSHVFDKSVIDDELTH